MASCPSCRAAVDDEVDLCLSCGEPLGDSLVARLTREASAAVDQATLPRPAPMPTPASLMKPTSPTPAPAADGRVRAAAPPSRPTLPSSPRAKRRAVDEPEPVRCPGCGVPSRAARCPGCGAVLRHDD